MRKIKNTKNKYIEEYYCELCGMEISEDIFDDNNGMCDDCFIEKRTWEEIPFGEDQW